ncbi:MAG: hypothetical protein K0R24_1880 [Gammaproteobacteria bacterium]|jgi:hypothetical protein|nr:hypothetical protein [Gammaproteobacteria bacterium]
MKSKQKQNIYASLHERATGEKFLFFAPKLIEERHTDSIEKEKKRFQEEFEKHAISDPGKAVLALISAAGLGCPIALRDVHRLKISIEIFDSVMIYGKAYSNLKELKGQLLSYPQQELERLAIKLADLNLNTIKDEELTDITLSQLLLPAKDIKDNPSALEYLDKIFKATDEADYSGITKLAAWKRLKAIYIKEINSFKESFLYPQYFNVKNNSFLFNAIEMICKIAAYYYLNSDEIVMSAKKILKNLKRSLDTIEDTIDESLLPERLSNIIDKVLLYEHEDKTQNTVNVGAVTFKEY